MLQSTQLLYDWIFLHRKELMCDTENLAKYLQFSGLYALGENKFLLFY